MCSFRHNEYIPQEFSKRDSKGRLVIAVGTEDNDHTIGCVASNTVNQRGGDGGPLTFRLECLRRVAENYHFQLIARALESEN